MSRLGQRTLSWSIDHPDLIVGVVEAENVTIGPSPPELLETLEAVVAKRSADWPTERIKGAIRELLRRGGYKPSGRGKPASEYLAGVARKGAFPRINTIVDINNVMSLETGWPMSVLDRERLLGDYEGLEVRFGREGERYVFNSVGQEIDLKGLIGVGQAEGPLLGNPVKDSLAAKTDDTSRHVLAIIYTSTVLTNRDGLLAVARRYGELLARFAGTSHVAVQAFP